MHKKLLILGRQNKNLLKLGRSRRAKNLFICHVPIAIFFLMIAKRPEPLQLFLCATCRFKFVVCKCCSCIVLVEQRGSQRALNVSMCHLRSPFTCNVYFFICTGNKAVYFLLLHRNNVNNIAAL